MSPVPLRPRPAFRALIFAVVLAATWLYDYFYQGNRSAGPAGIAFDLVLLFLLFQACLFTYGQFTLPVRTLRDRMRVFGRLLLRARNAHGATIFVQNGRKVERRGESGQGGAGLLWIDTASAAITGAGSGPKRVLGPGIHFLSAGERISSTFSLHAQTYSMDGKTGIVSTAGILNQDAFILSQLASDVIKTKNIDTTASLYADADSMKFSDSVDFDAADVIVIAGLNPSQWERTLPALDAGIRKKVSRGAKLIVLNSGETRIASEASISVQADEASTLAQIAKALIDKGSKAGKELANAVSGLSVTEDIEKAAELIAKAQLSLLFSAHLPSSMHREICPCSLILK